MGNWLKQSTAVTVKFGPFLDKTDGVTEETGLTIAQADIRLTKNGGNIAQSNNVAGATHDELGYYDVPLDATDTNTLGTLRIAVHDNATHLPVWQDFMVVPANIYDAMIAGSDKLQVDIAELGGVVQSLTDLKDFADSGYDPVTNKVKGVVLADNVTNVTNNVDINSNADITAIKTKTDNLPTDTDNLLQLLLGLHGKNIVIDDTNYVNGKMDTATIYIYNSKDNAVIHNKVTGLLKKYTVSANLSGTNTILHKVVEEP